MQQPGSGQARAHHSSLLRWMMHLGMPGVFLVAVIDASIIPMPVPGSTDLLLLFLIARRGNPWELAACAIAGSLIGGYITWKLGKTGGDAAMHRYVPARLLDPTKRWMENHPVLAVFFPAILPPPIPLSPFLLAAGALGIARGRFLAVFGAARVLRYGLIAWLGATYGRKMIRVWSGTIDKWTPTVMWIFAGLTAAGVAFGIWKLRRRNRQMGGQPALQTTQGD